MAILRPMPDTLASLRGEVAACRLCMDRFAATQTAHRPRPVPWFFGGARIVLAGQAPGMRVHNAGRPFADPSGDRLRAWMGIDADTFYDTARVSVLPMAFCFPGYTARGADLPPPPLCRETWHDRIMAALGEVPLLLTIGGYAHRYHLRRRAPVTEIVRGWRAHAPRVFPLPHPSWRNTRWLKQNPWFEEELLPVLRHRVAEVLT